MKPRTIMHKVNGTAGRIARFARAPLDRFDAALGLTEDTREEGSSTVEFTLLLPLFLAIFLASFEASLLLIRQVMLERGVDIAVRTVRLDAGNTVTQNALRNDICDRAVILPDCRANLLVELTEIDRVTYDVPTANQPCVNREQSITPPAAYETDRTGKLVLLRACFAVDPFMPGSGLAAELVTDDDEDTIRMVASTAFVVEQ